VRGPYRVLLVAIALGAVACSSSSKPAATSTPSTSATPTTARSAATITKFVVPASVQCGKGTSTTVPVSYAISGAQRQGISVDGRQDPLTSPSGTIAPPVHCDPLPHTVTLFAYDAQGRLASAVKNLTTTLPAG